MKKIILTLIFTMQPIAYSFCADEVTSGNVGLILVSTRTSDKTRSWGDKYNDNFRVTASTLGTAVSDISALKASTGSIIGMMTTTYATVDRANAIAISTGKIVGILTTTYATIDRANAVAVSTGLIIGILTTTYATLDRANSIAVSTGAIIGIMTTTYATVDRADAVGASTGSIIGMMTTTYIALDGTGRMSTATVSTDLTVGGQVKTAGMTQSSSVIVTGSEANLNSVQYTLPSDNGNANEYLQTDGSGVLSWAAAAGGGGGVTFATSTKVMYMYGDIYTSTNTPVYSWSTKKSTVNIIDVHLSLDNASSLTDNLFRIGKSTGGVNPSWGYVSGDITISAGTNFSIDYSTSYIMYPQESYGVFISSCQQFDRVGKGLSAQFPYWEETVVP